MGKELTPELLEKITNNYLYSDVSIYNFIFNFLLTLILTFIVSFIYRRYGRSFSNRKEFSNLFPLLGLATFFIITVVKSSLALSLGLVGALSIVRFRAAIKDPEELIYLFIAISIGLGLGANQVIISIFTIIGICFYIFLREKINSKNEAKQINLLISYPKSSNIDFDELTEYIMQYNNQLILNRYIQDKNGTQIYLKLGSIEFDTLRSLQKVLFERYKDIEFDFMDNNE